MTSRADLVVAVAGTATGIGKTWTTAQVAGALRRRGVGVAARKPVQSYAPDEADRTDAHVLAAATGEAVAAVCPTDGWYPLAMAPPMAAELLGRRAVALAEVVGRVRWRAGVDVGLVETVGGLRSPVAHDGDSLSLVDAVGPDCVVLVTDATLGTINSTHMSVELLAAHRVVVFVNRYGADDTLQRRNVEWLAERLPVGPAVVTSVEDLVEWLSPAGRAGGAGDAAER